MNTTGAHAVPLLTWRRHRRLGVGGATGPLGNTFVTFALTVLPALLALGLDCRLGGVLVASPWSGRFRAGCAFR